MNLEEPQLSDTDAAQVQADVAAMTFGREPVLDSMPATADDLTRQWGALSERIRRGIIDSPDTRHVMASMVGRPVYEGLPDDAIRLTAPTDQKIARTLGRMSQLASVLHLPLVPDESISPDITYATGLTRPEHVRYTLAREKEAGHTELYESLRQHYSTYAARGLGLTSGEKELVALRYRYAREVKLLALMAELADEPGDMEDKGDGTVGRTLKSGVKMVMTREAAKVDPDLLDPTSWQSRKVIKDRVHAVVIGGREYIMKERKTARHTDTARNGHVDGLTSREEFEVARHFAGLGTIEHDGVALHWEKPVGYVEFPDGFSFCLFESEPELERAAIISSGGIRDELSAAIMQTTDLYEDEFQRIKQAAKGIWEADETRFLDRYKYHETSVISKIRHGLAKAKAVLGRKERPIWYDELTFEDFAHAKTIAQMYLAKQLLHSTIDAEGYVNTDMDGDALRVITRPGEKPVLDVTLFDFERYDTLEKWGLKPGRSKAVDIDFVSRGGGLFIVSDVSYVRSIRIAAVFALLQESGMPLKNSS